MSSLTLYKATVPTLTNGLRAFTHILRKAEAHAKSQGLDPEATYLQARLIEDQLPLIFQVQNATRSVRANVERLGGKSVREYDENEKTFADLYARIEVAIGLLAGLDEATVNGRALETIELPAGGIPITITVQDSLLLHGIPNFVFHVTTAYSILRSLGVPLGKRDFIGGFVGLDQ